MGMTGDGKHLYIADQLNAVIRRLDLATSTVTTIAGQLRRVDPNRRDGVGDQATFFSLVAVELYKGKLYMADYDRLRIMDLTTSAVTTVKDPSTGMPWTPPLNSTNRFINGIAFAGDFIYLANYSAIWKHDPAKGTFSLLAGDPMQSAFRNGTGLDARFYIITDLVSDGSKALYLPDECVVRRVDLKTAKVETVAGLADGGSCYQGEDDGKGQDARFFGTWNMAFSDGRVFVTDTVWSSDGAKVQLAPSYSKIREYDPQTGKVTTLSGTFLSVPATPGERDGAASEALFLSPWALWADQGSIYIGNWSAVRKLTRKTSKDTVSTLAGRLLDGPLIFPTVLASDLDHLYVFQDRVRYLLTRIQLADGSIEVLKGYENTTFPMAMPGGLVRLGSRLYLINYYGIYSFDLKTRDVQRILPITSTNEWPQAMATDGQNLYVVMKVTTLSKSATTIEHQVWQVSIAGKKKVLLNIKDLVSISKRLVFTAGALYLTNGTDLRMFDLQSGKLSTVAGNADKSGCADGIGGQARFTRLTGLASDGSSLFVGDAGCYNIRRIDLATKLVTTLAGSTKNKIFKAGEGTEAGINFPNHMVYHQPTKALYVSDQSENIVMKIIDPAGGGDS